MGDPAANLKERIQEDVKAAMRAQDKRRLGTLRLIMAAVKQREVDERVTVDDPALLAILEKMIKQRSDSITQYQSGGREDLAQQERYELDLIQGYLPRPLTDAELDALVDAAIQQTSATSIKEMGKVMAILRPDVLGRADMGKLGGRVKSRLSAG